LSRNIDGATNANLRDACHASFAKLDKYYNIYSDYCTIAILLDPRLKLDFYVDADKTTRQISDDQNSSWIQLKQAFDANYAAPASGEGTSLQSSDESSSRPFKKFKTRPPANPIRSYLKESPRVAEHTSILQWWQVNSTQFPELSLMARDYLAIPGTSTASERSFSGGKRVISESRCRLGAETIRACLCLKSWMGQPWWDEDEVTVYNSN
jgi:hypothetical protein